MDSAPTSCATTIIKSLASCNQPTRSRAVRLLSRWLPQQSSAATPISDGDLLKIWKGLFYCVWHADKLPFQLDLINRLSLLLVTLDSDLAVRYFESFLITIRREWSGIDLLRLDKFYLLIRKFMLRFFALLKKNYWQIALLNRLVGMLSEKCLLCNDKFQANGVSYHIAEVFLDEIAGFLPIKPKTLDLLLQPFVSALKRSRDRVLVNKITANVFERLAQNGGKYLAGERTEEVQKFGKYAFVLGFSGMFLKLAADEETLQGNRKALFLLRDRFLKLEKDFEKSGLEIEFGDGIAVEKVDRETVDEEAGSEVKLPKKRKNEKKALDDGEKKVKSKKKKENNALLGLVAESNGVVENGRESNGGETKRKAMRKKRQKNDLLGAATECKGENGIESNGVEKTESEISKEKKAKKKNLLDVTAGSNVENGVESIGADNKSETNNNKKKNDLLGSAMESNGGIGEAIAVENANGDVAGNDDLVNFDETLISNLQKQFEKVAAEAGMTLPVTPVKIAATKKRKRAKSAGKLSSVSNEESTAGKNRDKNAKKVRFSMKNNIVWKPQTPMPPQSLRLPPSVTPRGSALKKGVPPGPIKESPVTVKKIKARGSSVMKARKSLKSVSPTAMRRRKILQGLSV